MQKRVSSIKQEYHEEVRHLQGKIRRIHLHVYGFVLQELSSVNYLELYRVADLFHLPALEEAVVGFLVEHLSELSQNRQDEAQLLPYRLLREVLKSDRLTSLSEEEIWKVLRPVCTSDAPGTLKYDVMLTTLMKTLLSHFVYVLMGASRELACVCVCDTHSDGKKTTTRQTTKK